MSGHTVASLTILCLATWLAASVQSAKETEHMNPSACTSENKDHR